MELNDIQPASCGGAEGVLCGDTAALYSDTDSDYDDDAYIMSPATCQENDGDLRNALAGLRAELNNLDKTVGRLERWAASTRSETDDRPLLERLQVIWDAAADLDRRLVVENAKLCAGLAKFNAAVAKTPKPDKGEMVALRAELGLVLKASDDIDLYAMKADILARCATEPVMWKLAEELRLAGREGGHVALYKEQATGL
jgi:hypothetical protein